MTDLETLQKEVKAGKDRIRVLEKENQLIRRQFAFYVQYGREPWQGDYCGGLSLSAPIRVVSPPTE